MYTIDVIDIEDVTVRNDVLNTHFSCDLDKCKGACCTLESEYGAPLSKSDVVEITKVLDIVFEYLPDVNKKEISIKGFFEEKDGDLMTTSINDRDCVFVYYENSIAKCAIEKAYFDGKIDYRKPISCHLFPIRISKFGNDIVRYEKFHECVPALELGAKKNITVAEFCKDSLTRLYGKKWYSLLEEFIGKK